MRHSFVVFPVLFLAIACGSIRERSFVPEPLTQAAQVPGLPGVRLLVDGGNPDLSALVRFVEQGPRPDVAGRHLTLLAISGGSDNGAFGAGLLCGWSEKKDRPNFDVVTGISTGGLSAPFAFLGSAGDAKLRAAFTTITADDIFESRGILKILGQRDALADSAPLVRLIERTFTAEDLVAVAREYGKGRKLYIGTTHMDADLFAVWDMGAIAASGHPEALSLFRKVMLASASIPVAFPPVYFDVEAEGTPYEEMHTDGGMQAQVFGAGFLEPLLARQGNQRKGTIYLIRNARITATYQIVEAKLADLAGRAISSLIRTQGIGDILRCQQVAARMRVGFGFACIPDEFQAPTEGAFDPKYMNALFDFAFARARAGYPWRADIFDGGTGMGTTQ